MSCIRCLETIVSFLDVVASICDESWMLHYLTSWIDDPSAVHVLTDLATFPPSAWSVDAAAEFLLAYPPFLSRIILVVVVTHGDAQRTLVSPTIITLIFA